MAFLEIERLTKRFGSVEILKGVDLSLDKGGFLSPSDLPAARQVLRAASLTYFASALLTLLDVTRLFRILRF